MYDWPETRRETDAFFHEFVTRMGLEGQINLMRPSDESNIATLWRAPNLLLGQTCWGPMNRGLARDVTVLAQPDYSTFDGGDGPFYRSAFVARAPLKTKAHRRFAYNARDSLSGYIAPNLDLEHGLEDTFGTMIETGAHRASIKAVADGQADIAAIDCRTWAMAQPHEPAAQNLAVVQWTQPRLGLPYICSPKIPQPLARQAQAALIALGAHPPQNAPS